MGYMCIMHIYMNICMIPSPAHETPPSNGLGPPGIPLYLVFCWYFVALGISTYAMHMLKSNSLPTTYSYIPTYIHTYIYIHNPLHIPDKPSCYILCLYTTYKLSTCYIFTLYALSTKNLCILYIYIYRTYILYIYNLYTIYILSRGYLGILSIYYLYATYILSYIYITYLVLCYVFCMLNNIYIYIYIHYTSL